MKKKTAGRLLITLLTALMIALLLPVAGVWETIHADPGEKTIISASAKWSTITKTSLQEFEVVTTSDVKYLMLYAEDGKTLVKTWQASGNSSMSGSNRKWTVSHAISNPGDRKLVFKGGTTSSTPVTNAVTVSFKVEASGIISATAKDAIIKKGTTQTFTVKSTADAKYLAEYAENGKLVKSWTASSSNSTVSGNVRTWTVSQTINDPGKRNLIFKVTGTTTPNNSQRTAAFTVVDVWVDEAKVESPVIGKGGTQYFTVKTSTNAQYLMLYAEGGNLVKTWAASGNSTVSGSVRTWKVELAIGTVGNRTLTLKAGKTTTPSSLGKSVKFEVAQKKIISATAKYAALPKGFAQEFTVVTTADFDYLMLFAEDGKTRVRAWASFAVTGDGYSGVDYRNLRTWTLTRRIETMGDRKLIFKGGNSSLTPVTDPVAVSFKVENSGIISATTEYGDITKGSTQVFYVYTTKDCNYLIEYADDGKTMVKTWTASGNSTIVGDVREWILPQNILTPGDRTLYFKAGITTTPTNSTRSVSFKVMEYVPINPIYFPDEVFREELSEHYDIDKDGMLSLAELSVTEMNISGKPIHYLNGIGFFTHLKQLYCYGCGLMSLYPKQNKDLEVLFCWDNELLSLDLSNNAKLLKLACGQNLISILNLDGAKALELLSCDNNLLTNLDVSNNTALKILECPFNDITELNLSNNKRLVRLDCSNCKITALNVSACTALQELHCYKDQLKNLTVNSGLVMLDADDNALTYLNVSACTGLKKLYCSYNKLSTLNVANNTALEELTCSSNSLTKLDVSKNTALLSLACRLNKITKLDVTNCTLLEELIVDPGVEVIGMHPLG